MPNVDVPNMIMPIAHGEILIGESSLKIPEHVRSLLRKGAVNPLGTLSEALETLSRRGPTDESSQLIAIHVIEEASKLDPTYVLATVLAFLPAYPEGVQISGDALLEIGKVVGMGALFDGLLKDIGVSSLYSLPDKVFVMTSSPIEDSAIRQQLIELAELGLEFDGLRFFSALSGSLHYPEVREAFFQAIRRNRDCEHTEPLLAALLRSIDEPGVHEFLGRPERDRTVARYGLNFQVPYEDLVAAWESMESKRK